MKKTIQITVNGKAGKVEVEGRTLKLTGTAEELVLGQIQGCAGSVLGASAEPHGELYTT